jgi:hypothetical protein
LLYRVFYALPYRASSGQPEPAMTFLFPGCLRGIPSNAGPRSLAIPGSSSPELRLLSRVVCCLTPARRPQPPSTFLGVSISFATQVQGVHLATGFPVPVYVPPPAFLTLSTAYSSLYLVGLFHPTATSEIPLQGFSPVPSRPDSSPARALLTFSPASLQPSCPACAGSRAPAFRALIQAPIRW